MNTDDRPDYRTAIGRDLQRLRRVRGLNLNALADATAATGTPMSPMSLSRIERGARDLRAVEVLALAAVLDVAPAALLTPSAHGDAERTVSVAGKSVRWDVARRWAIGEVPLRAEMAAEIDAIRAGHVSCCLGPHSVPEHAMDPMAEMAWQVHRYTPHTGAHRVCVETDHDQIWVSVDGGSAEAARRQLVAEAAYARAAETAAQQDAEAHQAVSV